MSAVRCVLFDHNDPETRANCVNCKNWIGTECAKEAELKEHNITRSLISRTN